VFLFDRFLLATLLPAMEETYEDGPFSLKLINPNFPLLFEIWLSLPLVLFTFSWLFLSRAQNQDFLSPPVEFLSPDHSQDPLEVAFLVFFKSLLATAQLHLALGLSRKGAPSSR